MNMENNYLNHKWTKGELVELREQIVLGSIYYRDYNNDFGVSEHKAFAFFDGLILLNVSDLREKILSLMKAS